MRLVLSFGVQGRKAPNKFFLAKFKNSLTIFIFQKWQRLHERCGMCWNEWKIKFPIFTIFSFWDMVVFVFKIGKFVMNFEYKSTITQKSKSENWLIIQSSTVRIFHLNMATSEGWGLYILCWEKFEILVPKYE